ncbi:hypothetical protein F5Y04DRAFT_289026 [Hypomontagnella monticulosa]|nr:hypothetical protein F5Y04DRAFT_289026 [Hypomontagnella monticulosa]
MDECMRVWLEPKEHSVEGHTRQCKLLFKGEEKWGPKHCHENTVKLRDAIHQADPRFKLEIWERKKTIEGHTVTISVSKGDKNYLNKLSTHPNMAELCQIIYDILRKEGCGPDSIDLKSSVQESPEGKTDTCYARTDTSFCLLHPKGGTMKSELGRDGTATKQRMMAI